MTSEFDREIAVRPDVDDGADQSADQSADRSADRSADQSADQSADDRVGTFGDGWRIGGGINGGLLLAALANGIQDAVGTIHPDPLVISAAYLSPAVPGPFSVRSQVVRRGRSTTTAQAALMQENGGPVERIRALATFGDLGPAETDVRLMSPPPPLPPPEQCLSARDTPPPFLEQSSLLHRLDLRLDPACSGWVAGRPADVGEMRAWLRFPDGREPDPLMLLLAVDALPPVTFDFGLYGWAPTISLTAYVRGRPAPGWLRIRTATKNLFGGSCEEDAEVWDSTGALVAQSRQLAFTPRT